MQHAASVGIMPTLNRKIAMAAATERVRAHASTVRKFGASNDNGNARTGTVSRNTVWIANQMARFETTPTTAAVMAESAALGALLPRSLSTTGAPREIQSNEGVNVTHVPSKPPTVPAPMSASAPG